MWLMTCDVRACGCNSAHILPLVSLTFWTVVHWLDANQWPVNSIIPSKLSWPSWICFNVFYGRHQRENGSLRAVASILVDRKYSENTLSIPSHSSTYCCAVTLSCWISPALPLACTEEKGERYLRTLTVVKPARGTAIRFLGSCNTPVLTLCLTR